MRRWNGWGDEATEVELPAHGEAFLAELIGPGQRLADASLQDVLARVPASRLAPNPLICVDAEVRVRLSLIHIEMCIRDSCCTGHA